MHRLVARAAIVFALAAGATPAGAAVFNFSQCVSDNSAADCAIGSAQMTVGVTAQGANQVLFQFANTGPSASSITDLYFDDGSLLDIASVVNGPGVDFSQNATPSNLPAGNNATPPFQTTAGFSADSNPPTQPNGVNPGEMLGIVFDLKPGKSFANVLTDLGGRALRIGIHVQGYASGGSESFINQIPEPRPWALMAAGILVIAWMARRHLD